MYRYSVRDTTDWIAEGNTIQSFADGKAFDALRRQRNYYLRQTDWWSSSDRTMTPEQIAYRQALRDLPSNVTDIDKVFWPDKPE